MDCPFCSYQETKVLESRNSEDSFRRRRECLKCSNRFTTYEKSIFNLSVIKKDNSIQSFDIDKIKLCMDKSCGKVEKSKILELSKNVEQKILRKKSNPITSISIAKFIMQELKKHDKMAYLRFASVYKEIVDIKEFEKELDLIA
jgi:transcriptional repressor NrdR